MATQNVATNPALPISLQVYNNNTSTSTSTVESQNTSVNAIRSQNTSVNSDDSSSSPFQRQIETILSAGIGQNKTEVVASNHRLLERACTTSN